MGQWDWLDWTTQGGPRWARYEGRWTAKESDHWVSLGCPPLFFCASQGQDDVVFLRSLDGLSDLMITGEVRDLSAIADCESLESLELAAAGPTKTIDLSRLRKLTFLRMNPDRTGGRLASLTDLRAVDLVWAGETLDEFRNLQRLELATLVLKKAQTLEPLSYLNRLGGLNVQGGRRLQRLGFASEMPGLRALEIWRAPELSRLDEVVVTPNLELVRLIRLKRLASVKPLLRLRGLRELVLDTDIADGEVRCLLDLPSLERVGLFGRKNLDLSGKEADDFSRRRKQMRENQSAE